MKVIIIGAGEVGYHIAKYLSSEGVDIVIIDKNGERLKRVVEELDVTVVEAEGGDPEALKEAGADKADILLAVTNNDETNMISCLLAKAMFKIPRKIARIRNPSYSLNKILLSKEHLDIDPAINPEMESAQAILRLLKVPFASEVFEFEKGKVLVIAYKVPKGSYLIGKRLRDLRPHYFDFLIGFILREDQVFIPKGDDIVKEGDLLYIPIRDDQISELAKSLGENQSQIKKMMIMGGGRIGYYLASLIEDDIEVKIIEEKKERCDFLSDNLKKSLILYGDASDKELLLEENIKDMDVFVATSNKDELNIMVCLLAKKLGVKKVIAIIHRSEYIPLAYNLGIESIINPRILTASIILQYIRKGDVLSLSAIGEHEAEIIEIKADIRSEIVGKAIKDIKLPKDVLVGPIIRGDEVIIPKGDTKINTGDRILFFVKESAVKKLEKLFKD